MSLIEKNKLYSSTLVFLQFVAIYLIFASGENISKNFYLMLIQMLWRCSGEKQTNISSGVSRQRDDRSKSNKQICPNLPAMGQNILPRKALFPILVSRPFCIYFVSHQQNSGQRRYTNLKSIKNAACCHVLKKQIYLLLFQ